MLYPHGTHLCLSVNRHAPVASTKFDVPEIGTNAFVAPSGLVLGKVALGEGASVWYNATVRGKRTYLNSRPGYTWTCMGSYESIMSSAGDYGSVSIGKNSNIQDNAYVGSASEFSPSVVIGENVSVGHGAVLKGCTVGANTLIGINAVISEGAQVTAYLTF